jgi:2-oxo-3-hexenedioate decarboxylase
MLAPGSAGRPMDKGRLDAIAGDLVAILGTGAQRDGFPGLGMADAYAVAERVRVLRRARGERPVGRKIGFTNTTIWERYGVDAPMWNFVYDSTLHRAEAAATCDLAGMPEPRVEPEVVLGLGRAPSPGMDEAALLGCCDWIAAGFEIVQTVYPGWRMTGPEAAAAFGLHGALFVGPRREVRDRAAVGAALSGFSVEMKRDGVVRDRGHARNVLGGPLSALRFLIDEIARYPGAAPLGAGEIVTTGTLTDAWPAAAGERWTAEFAGIDLPVIELTFAR